VFIKVFKSYITKLLLAVSAKNCDSFIQYPWVKTNGGIEKIATGLNSSTKKIMI